MHVDIEGWEIWEKANKTKQNMDFNTSHKKKNNNMRGFWQVCVCVNKHCVHPGVQQNSHLTEIFHKKVQNLHHIISF